MFGCAGGANSAPAFCFCFSFCFPDEWLCAGVWLMWRRVCSLAVEGTGRGFRALDATAFARRRRGQLFQAGAQLLGQAQLIRSGSGTRGGGSSACSHGQLDSGHDFRVADAHAHPASLTAGMGL